MADPLATVLRVRKLAVDQARAALACALVTLASEEEAVRCAIAGLVHEARAMPKDAADPLAGAFAAWLPAARSAIAATEQAAMRAGQAVRDARAGLAARQADLEAAELMEEQRAKEAALAASRRAQRVLDERAGVVRSGRTAGPAPPSTTRIPAEAPAGPPHRR